jgi:hypothetical protein
MRDRLRLILVAVGIFCLIVTALECWFLSSFKSTGGIVDDVDANHVYFSYNRFNGVHWGYTLESTHVVSYYKKGDSAMILYDPSGKTALLATSAWLFGAGLGVPGILLVATGLYLLRSRHAGQPGQEHSGGAREGG